MGEVIDLDALRCLIPDSRIFFTVLVLVLFRDGVTGAWATKAYGVLSPFLFSEADAAGPVEIGCI